MTGAIWLSYDCHMTTTKVLRIEAKHEQNICHAENMNLPVTNKGFFTHYWEKKDEVFDYDDEGASCMESRMLMPPVIHNDVHPPSPFEVCGFKDIAQLLNWFHEDVLEWCFENFDIEVVEYEVDEEAIFYGTWQILVDCRLLENRKPVKVAP